MRSTLRETALWAGAVLGLLSVVTAVVAAVAGFSFLIFRSGSMEPEIPTGGLALSRHVDASDIRVGDVVSVTAANGDRITHRVVSTTVRDGRASLVLKGDANRTPDTEVYDVASADRVVASVPVAGYVLARLLTPPGLVAAGALSLMLVLLAWGGSRDEDREDVRPSPRTPGRRARHRSPARAGRRLRAGGLTLALLGAGAVALTHATGTWAFFSDTAYAATPSSTAADLSTPALPTSTQTQTTSVVALSWTSTAVGSTTATAYEVVRYPSATGGTATSVCTTTTATSCTDVKQTGPVWYAVRARIGDQWVEESGRTAYNPDVTGPALAITQPRFQNVSSSNMRGQVASCSPAGVICGTATDPAGTTLTEYTFRRQVTIGVVTTTSCWSGSAWVTTTATTCTTFAPTTGTATWSVPGNPATAYPDLVAATFTLGLRSTDGFGNVSSGSVSYNVVG